jgi:hypothetical protein
VFTSAAIFPLAQHLHARIPRGLQRWTGEPTDATIRDQLADDFLMIWEEHIGDVGEEANLYGVVISEALAGFLTQWGCRYGNLDEDIDRAQAALVTALGGVVQEPGVYAVAVGTPITIAAIAHLIGWVCILDVEESPA